MKQAGGRNWGQIPIQESGPIGESDTVRNWTLTPIFPGRRRMQRAQVLLNALERFFERILNENR